ncbi:retinol dehydrogenase [Rhypophila decipiens]
MPIPFLTHVLLEGPPDWMPEAWTLVKWTSSIGALALTKWYSAGATNKAEKNLHGRVILMTGGTSGIGAVTTYELAKRGAQVVLLTHQSPSDPFLIEFVEDMRERTENQFIYAEQVDLSSLHSIRQFATRWVDNSPPRRLDAIILGAATMTPPGGARKETAEGIETTWMVNYLGNFHLLGILSPAIRAQPFDRDVRIVVTTCSSYISSPPLDKALEKNTWSPKGAYARSKLALMVFACAYQKHLDAYKRPDQLPMNARVILADPGFTRTPGTMRWLSRGTIWGLFIYILMYPIWWLLLKSANMGAQSILFAVMDSSMGPGRNAGGKMVKECIQVDYARKDVCDEEVAKKLWESSDKLIEKAEKEAALKRAKAKKAEEMKQEEAREAEKVEEIDALLETIAKGRAKKAQKEKEKEKEKGNKDGKKSKSAKSK